MNAVIGSRWRLRGRVFVRAILLGAIFGAISRALAYPVMAVAAGIQDGDSVITLLGTLRLFAFAPVTGLLGAGVGTVIGVVIGIVVAPFAPYMSANTRATFIRAVVLVITIGAMLIVGRVSHFSVIWCVVPGAFAIVLGQVGARWLITEAQS